MLVTYYPSCVSEPIKYDFYKNPPKSKADLYDWLTSWLELPSPRPMPFVHNKEIFIQELGFCHAFHMHGVFRNVKTNEYVWWVLPSEEAGDFSTFPTIRYPTYDAMLEHVINDYYIQWKLTD